MRSEARSPAVQVEPHTGGLQSFAVRIKDGLATGSTPGLAKPQNAELRSGSSSEGAHHAHDGAIGRAVTELSKSFELVRCSSVGCLVAMSCSRS